jgi:KipI family sensor histidine kinase inhibitor
MPNYRLLPAGDTALVVEFGDQIDRELNMWVLALDHRLRQTQIEGIVDCVPTFRSLLVHYDPLLLPAAALVTRIDDLIPGLRMTEAAGRVWRLPACYDASLAPDLDDVAAHTSLSPAQVVERHSAVTYHVYMLGFLPGQAYMGDLPPELALPRRECPRLRVPAGSLAIATTMTCIFPMETPCGWHLIGRSPVRLWERTLGAEPLLAPGDKVTFAPVSLREYEHLAARAAEGVLKIVPADEMVGAAA